MYLPIGQIINYNTIDIMLKKRYIALIAGSTVSLLFASLVYCALVSFPELLETEQNKEIEYVEELNDEPVFDNYLPEVQVEEEPQVALVLDYPSKNVDEVTVSSTLEEITSHADDHIENYVYADSIDLNIEILTVDEPQSVVEDYQAEETVEFVEEAVDIVIEEDNEITYSYVSRWSHELDILPIDSALMASSEEDLNEDEELLLVEEKDALNVVQENNNAILECTLMVIGIVDLLSLLLIKRKRNRLFHL